MIRGLGRKAFPFFAVAITAGAAGTARASDVFIVSADPAGMAYDPIIASPEGVFGGQVRAILVPRYDKTGYLGPKWAFQSDSAEALATGPRVEAGERLYRIGTTRGKHPSLLGDGQFWLLDNPASADQQADMGMPRRKVRLTNFIESGRLAKGAPFVTREIALGGGRSGTLIEIITTGDFLSPRGVEALETYSTLKVAPDAKGVLRIAGELKGRGRLPYGRSTYTGPGRRLATRLRAMDMPSASRVTAPASAEAAAPSPAEATLPEAEALAETVQTRAAVPEPSAASELNLTALRRIGGARIPYTPSIGGAMMGVSFGLHASREGLVPTLVGAGAGVVAWETGTRATVWAVGSAARVTTGLVAGRAAGRLAGRIMTKLGTRAVPILGEVLLAGDIALAITNRIAGYDATWSEVWDAWTGQLDVPTRVAGLPPPPDQALYVE